MVSKHAWFSFFLPILTNLLNMFIYVLGLNSVFCKRHPNSFDSNISREYYSHGEGNARVKMGKKKENQACLETIWKLCVYLKKTTNHFLVIY
jgi:hypothetical protein